MVLMQLLNYQASFEWPLLAVFPETSESSELSHLPEAVATRNFPGRAEVSVAL